MNATTTTFQSPIKKLQEQAVEIDDNSQVSGILASRQMSRSLPPRQITKLLGAKDNLSKSSTTGSDFLSDEDSGDNRMTLGFIWKTVLNEASKGSPISSPRRRRHVRSKDRSKSPDELLIWAVQRLRENEYSHLNLGENDYKFEPTELALLALIDSFEPLIAQYEEVDPENQAENVQKVIKALETLKIHCFAYDNDNLNYNVNSKDLLTQIAAIKLALDNPNGSTNEVVSRGIEFELDEDDLSTRNNLQYANRKFGITINVDPKGTGETRPMALSFVPEFPFINPSGRKITIAEPNFHNDENQQFIFGKGIEWSTVIDSFAQKGLVWDVCDEFNLDPPEGTPFYLFPFHGRHNQHFVYRDEDGRIIAKQNGHAVTYVGGDCPFVMMKVSEEMKDNQTFNIELLS